VARKNHGVTAFLRYGLLGVLAGTILGTLVGALFVAISHARFEANIALYRVPTNGTSSSARDFIAATLARQDFLRDFVAKRRLEAKAQARLTRNLTVVAKDASRPLAEMRLVGSDPAAITMTLDALATYMVEVLHSTQNTALQSQLRELDPVIDAASRRYYELMTAQFEYGRLPSSALHKIRVATTLARQRLQIELAQRYRLKPRSAADEIELQRRLNDIIKQQERLTPSMDEHANVDSDHFELESAFALAGAELRVLKQTKRRLLSEFDRAKPLLIVRRAKAIPLTTEHAPVVVLAAACGLIGGLCGGFAWSKRQSRNGKLTGPIVERRLGVPVVGVMAESLTDYGEREQRPMAQADPQPLAVAGVRSLNVALHLLAQKRSRVGPVVFTEIGDGRHASHVIANLAVVMAQTGERVLIVEASDSDGQLSGMFANDKGIARTIALDVGELGDEQDAEVRPGNGSIRFAIGDAGAVAPPVPLAVISHFDCVLIHNRHLDRARRVLKGYGTGVGLVVCTAEARVSVVRKALARTLHGVVLCAYAIDESDYLGESATG